MKKKWIITISSLIALAGLIVLLAFTVFSLKKVTLDFRTSTSYITATHEEIIESAEFKMGKSVLIHSKREYKNKIESFDPYLKVINIETVFPSSFVVHLAERQEVYAIPFEYGHYICDEDLRVLRISYTYQNTDKNAILLNYEGVEIKNDYVESEYINLRKPSIYSAMYGLNRPLGEQKSLIENVTLSTEYDSVIKRNQTVTTLKYYSGQTFKIINDSFGLEYKTKLMNDVYAQLYTFIGKTITDQNKNQILLTEDNLKDCTVLISNYYDYTTYSEKDCYFNIIIK